MSNYILKNVPIPFVRNKGTTHLLFNILFRRQVPNHWMASDITFTETVASETSEIKRARLLYQSRKRGMLENDLIFSTFIDKYLFSMDDYLLTQYDNLINSSYTDWDMYYWMIGSKEIPKEFDNEVMALLREHVKNKKKELRIRQPDLPNHKWTK